jgi:hypothetical protein
LLIAAGHQKLRTLNLCEDEVTSTIFGMMQYLPAKDVLKIINAVANDAGIEIDRFYEERKLEAQFEFWPHWETTSGYVEPDVVIHFRSEGATILHVIIENKWESRAWTSYQVNLSPSLSPPCQLVRQWGHRDINTDSAPWIHFYLVSDTSQGRKDVNKSIEDPCNNCDFCKELHQEKGSFKGLSFDLDAWKRHLGCIGWRHICAAANDAQPYGLWVKEFLSIYGIVSFMGFADLQVYPLDTAFTGEFLFFEEEPWFKFLGNRKLNITETDKEFFLYSENWFTYLDEIVLDHDEVDTGWNFRN